MCHMVLNHHGQKQCNLIRLRALEDGTAFEVVRLLLAVFTSYSGHDKSASRIAVSLPWTIGNAFVFAGRNHTNSEGLRASCSKTVCVHEHAESSWAGWSKETMESYGFDLRKFVRQQYDIRDTCSLDEFLSFLQKWWVPLLLYIRTAVGQSDG